jgi:hypothetical protein
VIRGLTALQENIPADTGEEEQRGGDFTRRPEDSSISGLSLAGIKFRGVGMDPIFVFMISGNSGIAAIGGEALGKLPEHLFSLLGIIRALVGFGGSGEGLRSEDFIVAQNRN